MELDTWILRSLDALLHIDMEVSEVRVDSDTPRLMILDIVADFVTSEASLSIILGYIIRVLRLVEVGSAVFTIPLEQVANGMFGCESVAGDVVSIDLETSLDWISLIPDQTSDTVVSSPQPSVIDDNIAAVYLDHQLGLHFILIGSTDSGEDIVHSTWILSVPSIAFITPLQKYGSLNTTGLKEKSRNSDTIDIFNLDA